MKFVPMPHLSFRGRIQKLNVNGAELRGREDFGEMSSFRARKKMPPFAMPAGSPKRTALPLTPSSTRLGR